MALITYLLGAGASAQALPIVKNFPDAILKVAEILNGPNYLLSREEKFEKLPRWEFSKDIGRAKLIEDLRWLGTQAKEHASVDTFAKKLYLKGKYKELDILKSALSAYLVLAQIGPNYDKRYDAFLASILKEQNRFPNHIRLVTWNYDFQLEKAYSDFYSDSRMDSLYSMLRVVTKYSYEKPNSNDFAVYKLNGDPTVVDNNGWHRYFFHYDIRDSLSILNTENLIRNYLTITHAKIQGYHSGLSFAWEEYENKEQLVIDKAIAGTRATEVLVIIGYSFPFFNREIDRKLIEPMINLKQVYFQDINPNAIKLRFQAIRKNVEYIKLSTYEDVEQFLLPNEL